MKNLVILGGGYGGMRLLSLLIPNVPYDTMIILIDRVPFHFLKTEYYALAAGTISDQTIQIPFPNHPQVTIIQKEVESIHLKNRAVQLADDTLLHYHQLVVGLGCEDDYHDIPGAKEYTNSIQTFNKSKQTYQQLNDLSEHSKVAIIGGGLTGVEIAAELAESRKDLQLSLYDRGNKLLSSCPVKVQNYVEDWFKQQNVQIHTNSTITKIEKNLLYNQEKAVHYDCIIWTAGVKPNRIMENIDSKKDKKGRIILSPYHHLPEDENVFIVGDCASLPFPPSAQLAQGQAEQIAIVIKTRWKGQSLPYAMPPIKTKGVLGSLGKKQGFGLIANTALTGRIPRILKNGVLWKNKVKR